MNASLDNADSVESLVNEGYQYGFVTDIEGSTSLSIWNGVPCVPATSTVPMIGKVC